MMASSILQNLQGAPGQNSDGNKPKPLDPETKQYADRINQVRTQAGVLNNVVGILDNRMTATSTEPLPTWPDLFDSIDSVKNSITRTNRSISKNEDKLDQTIMYPLANFPRPWDPAQLFLDLKPNEDAKALISTGMTALRKSGKTHDDLEEFSKMLDWALDTVGASFISTSWNADYTEEELEMGYEKVNTGIRRELSHVRGFAGEDDDEDDGDEEMESEETTSSKPAVPPLPREASDIRKAPKLDLEQSMRYLVRPEVPTR